MDTHSKTHWGGISAVEGRLDFAWHRGYALLALWQILIVPAIVSLPEECAYENGPIENLQLLVLAACIMMCLKAKVDKTFFRSLALLCVVLVLREVNCGRTLFFPREGCAGEFLKWDEIPYGYLAHPLFGLFIAGVAVYFFATGSYKVLWRYACRAKIAVGSWLCAIWGFAGATAAERESACMPEELCETLFFLALATLIHYHAFSPERNGCPPDFPLI